MFSFSKLILVLLLSLTHGYRFFIMKIVKGQSDRKDALPLIHSLSAPRLNPGVPYGRQEPNPGAIISAPHGLYLQETRIGARSRN